MLRWVLVLAVATVAPSVFPSPSSSTGARQGRRTPTAIQWEVRPASVVVYLDDKKLGLAGDLELTPTAPGRHTIRLVNGRDESEMEVEVTRGHILRFVLDFSG